MITEDYVSFEVAKLLKEKGFNKYVRQYYVFDHEFGCAEFVFDDREDNPNDWGTDYYSAPTHQMAMKWLREEYKIMITIIPQEVNIGVDRMCYGIYRITEDLYQPLYNGKVDNLVDSYEEVVEAAIMYCLENLI